MRPPSRSPIGRNTGDGNRTPRCSRAHRRAEGEDVARGGQLVGGRGEVDRRAHGARVERQADDRVRDVVDRHDVDAKVASCWNDPELARQEQPQRRVERVERLDLARPRVANDHRGPDDRDRELRRGVTDETFGLVLRLLVRAPEAEGVGQVVLAHGARPTPGDVRRRHVDEAIESVGRPREVDDVRHAVDVRAAQVLDGRIDAQVGSGVDDVGDALTEIGVRAGIETQPRLRDVPGDRVDPGSELGTQIRLVPPGPVRRVDRLGIGVCEHERDDLEIGALEQASRHLGTEEAGPPGEQHYVAHAGTPHPCSAAKVRRSSRFLRAAARCAS